MGAQGQAGIRTLSISFKMTSNQGPLVSVIVPCYNVERFIDRCVTSLLDTEYENKELIFVNDGSIDHTLDKLHRWSKQSSLIKIIDKPNEGVSSSRNKGIAESKGKYLMFVDPDDYVTKEFITIPVREMENSKSEALMFGFACDWTGRMETFAPLDKYDFHDNQTVLAILFPRIFGVPSREIVNYLEGDVLNPKKETGQVWRWIYKKDFIERHNISFPQVKVGEDMAFNAECLLYAKRIKSIDNPLYVYLPRKDGLMYSNVNGLNSLENKLDMLNERLRLGAIYSQITGVDALNLFAGSNFLSVLELAKILSKEQHRYGDWMRYASHPVVKKSISLLPLKGKRIKALIPLALLKIGATRVLFNLFALAQKLNIKIAE